MLSNQQTAAPVTSQSNSLNDFPDAPGFLKSVTPPAFSSLAEVCNMLGIEVTQAINEDTRVFPHLNLREGQRLFEIGQPQDSIYIVHTGFLKTQSSDGEGTPNILAFPMKGDLIGLDGLFLRAHQSACVALSRAVVVLLPVRALQGLTSQYPGLDFDFMQLLSKYLMQQQSVTTLVNTLSAEARVARFLVWMSNRYAELGYSSKEFTLRMTRNEIGSYLGLTIETVSRTMSMFKELGYIDINQRVVTLKDLDSLQALKRAPCRNRSVKPVLSSMAEKKDAGTQHTGWDSARKHTGPALSS